MGPGRKPKLLVFSCGGSNIVLVVSGSVVHTCSVCKTAFKFIAHLKNHLHKHKGIVKTHY